jgi:hypothetical protein
MDQDIMELMLHKNAANMFYMDGRCSLENITDYSEWMDAFSTVDVFGKQMWNSQDKTYTDITTTLTAAAIQTLRKDRGRYSTKKPNVDFPSDYFAQQKEQRATQSMLSTVRASLHRVKLSDEEQKEKQEEAEAEARRKGWGKLTTVSTALGDVEEVDPDFYGRCLSASAGVPEFWGALPMIQRDSEDYMLEESEKKSLMDCKFKTMEEIIHSAKKAKKEFLEGKGAPGKSKSVSPRKTGGNYGKKKSKYPNYGNKYGNSSYSNGYNKYGGYNGYKGRSGSQKYRNRRK